MIYTIPQGATITGITEDYEEKVGWSTLEGLLIATDKGNIKVMIANEQNCCEDASNLFLETPDDLSTYIGAEVLQIEDICIGLTADTDGYGFDAGGETQLKVTTSKGVLQYAIYNNHNGYYSHATLVQVFDSVEKGSL